MVHGRPKRSLVGDTMDHTTTLSELEGLGVTVREATEDDADDLCIPGRWYWFEPGNWCGPFDTSDAATSDAAAKFLS